MFGIMNQTTGRCWPSRGLWYQEDLQQYLYQSVNIDVVAVPLAYVNTKIIKKQGESDFYEVK